MAGRGDGSPRPDSPAGPGRGGGGGAGGMAQTGVAWRRHVATARPSQARRACGAPPATVTARGVGSPRSPGSRRAVPSVRRVGAMADTTAVRRSPGRCRGMFRRWCRPRGRRHTASSWSLGGCRSGDGAPVGGPVAPEGSEGGVVPGVRRPVDGGLRTGPNGAGRRSGATPRCPPPSTAATIRWRPLRPCGGRRPVSGHASARRVEVGVRPAGSVSAWYSLFLNRAFQGIG